MTSSPFKVVSVTGPTADSQLILNAERVAGTPTEIEDGYFKVEKTGRFPQVNEPYALIRLPVMVFSVMEAMASPPDKMRFFTAIQSLFAFWDNESGQAGNMRCCHGCPAHVVIIVIRESAQNIITRRSYMHGPPPEIGKPCLAIILVGCHGCNNVRKIIFCRV